MPRWMRSATQAFSPCTSDESYPGLLLYCLSMWWEQLSGLDGILAHTDEQVSFADDEGFKFMMNEYKKFYDNGWLNKDTATSTDSYNVFLQGGSALHTLYFGDYETYHEALGDDFGMLPVPLRMNHSSIRILLSAASARRLACPTSAKIPTWRSSL